MIGFDCLTPLLPQVVEAPTPRAGSISSVSTLTSLTVILQCTGIELSSQLVSHDGTSDRRCDSDSVIGSIALEQPTKMAYVVPFTYAT